MITSTSNAEIKNIIKLLKNTKLRKEQGVFVVEGIRMFREVSKQQIKKIYVSETAVEKYKVELENVVYEIVSDHVYKTMSDTQSPQGVMVLVNMLEYELESILKKENPLLIILDNLQDPGNLGTIIRTAEGAGIDGIIMSKDTVDVYNPKVVRATMGSVFRVPIVVVEDLVSTLDLIRAKDINVFGAHLLGESFYRENYKTGSAFLIGNEGNGLSDIIASKANKLIKIKMLGKVESLNAATAATVLMYEAMRQREN